MPLPLAMMIPFMGIQSAVMAKQFGENFQFGKRRISAMSNEEFNKLTPKIINEKAAEELKSMIPSMEASIIEMRTFQTFLIKEFILMVRDLMKSGLGELLGIKEGSLVDKIIDYFDGKDTGGVAPPVETPIVVDGKLAPPPEEFPKPSTPAEKVVFTVKELSLFNAYFNAVVAVNKIAAQIAALSVRSGQEYERLKGTLELYKKSADYRSRMIKEQSSWVRYAEWLKQR